MVDAVITAEEGLAFTNNTAVTGAGGGIYRSAAVAWFDGSIFTANEAVWGGDGVLESTQDISFSVPRATSAAEKFLIVLVFQVTDATKFSRPSSNF